MRLVLVQFIGMILLLADATADSTLQNYVNAPDPAYRYRVSSTLKRPGCTIHLLKMTSQTWRSPEEVNRTQWSHWMEIVVPDGAHNDIAMLIIEGGLNLPFRPSLDNPVSIAAEYIATSTRSVVVAMGQVPNEPLQFTDTPENLIEDEIVAYSWAKAMATGDYTWPVYVPMVKSAVRAMDTVQAFLSATDHPVKQFVLVGFSKRGATAWLTSAVDARVLAFAAGVFDVIDIVDQIEHQYAAYGRYSREMHAYQQYGVLQRLRAPEGAALLEVVDPYAYLDRIQQPKFLINGTGDPFFLPDAAMQYFDHLRGETLLRYVPNAGHSLQSRETTLKSLLDNLISWYETLLSHAPRPQITWSIENDRIQVRSTPPPVSARLWQASNSRARDFRMKTIGRSWTSMPLVADRHGAIAAILPRPDRGWRAYFVELRYPGTGDRSQVYSTPVVVRPDRLPHALTSPVGEPHDADYWKDMIARVLRDDFSTGLSSTELKSYFPMPLFDLNLDAPDAAQQILNTDREPGEQARRHCLATRLNIARRQLGWYSPVTIRGARESLWRRYRTAHDAYLKGDFARARDLCEAMNQASAAKPSSRANPVHRTDSPTTR